MRPPLLRALVLDIHARVMDSGELADRALNRALRAHPELHSVERRHVAEASYAMVRLCSRLDFLLSAGLAAHRLPALGALATPEAHRLRYAAAVVAELGETPAVAANLTGTQPKFVPVLEAVRRADVAWPADPVARLAVERSLPAWLAARLFAVYGASADALAAALNVRAPLTLRANTLKATREVVIERLAAEKQRAQPGTLSPWSLALEGRPNVFSLEAYKSGLFEVQDEGSQLIALAVGAKAGELVVDACAGAGGKSLALAAAMNNKGRLVVCDVTADRLEDVKPRAKRAGVFLLDPRVVAEDVKGEPALKPLLNRADAVLVDAPCSGTGAFRRHPDARWKLSEGELAKFPPLQKSILERYARLVKSGGRLIYATCSLLPEENEAVAEAFAAGHPEFEPLPITGLPASTLDARGRLVLLPNVHGTDGFFAAAFRRR